MAIRTLERKPANATATIADMGARRITKQPLPTVGTDAKVSALALASEVMATMQTQANVWHGFAWRIINGTTDFRVEFLRLMRENLDKMRNENAKAHDWDKKTTRRETASYVVNASRMATIAKGFNAGATVDGLAEYHDVPDPENLGYMAIYEYAKTFNETEARGRKADSFKVALKKFLDKRAESLASDTDKVNHARVVAYMEQLQD